VYQETPYIKYPAYTLYMNFFIILLLTCCCLGFTRCDIMSEMSDA